MVNHTSMVNIRRLYHINYSNANTFSLGFQRNGTKLEKTSLSTDVSIRFAYGMLICHNRLMLLLLIDYLFLFTILVSYFPVSISINLTNKDTLLSSLRLVHTSFVNVSMSPEIPTHFGSPSKLGSGFPSCI